MAFSPKPLPVVWAAVPAQWHARAGLQKTLRALDPDPIGLPWNLTGAV
jgi:hypothetical protein